MADTFDALLDRIRSSNIASRYELVGCSSAEIQALEAKYELRLPRTYRRYLELMGHQSGHLFTSDHMAVFYRYVLAMTAEQRQEWVQSKAQGSGPPLTFDFPTDGLLIAGRLSDQFEFIRCHGQEDSRVWYFNTWEWQVTESHASVLAWLNAWCAQAERAIARGYFRNFGGTVP